MPNTIIILSLPSFLTVVATTVILLDSVSQSGRHAVCLDEDILYSCSSFTDSLIWNIYSRNGDRIDSIVFIAGDKPQLQQRNQAVVIFLNNAPRNLTSQLVIPYMLSWNGTTIECMNMNDSQHLPYVIAGKLMIINLTVGLIA